MPETKGRTLEAMDEIFGSAYVGSRAVGGGGGGGLELGETRVVVVGKNADGVDGSKIKKDVVGV